MKKSKLLLCLVIASLVLMAACGGNPVKKDLESYFRDVFPTITKRDEEIVLSYAAVMGEDYRENTLFRDALHDELIPAVDELVEYAKSVTLSTQDVQDAHDMIIGALEAQHEAYILFFEAIASGNYGLINDANARLATVGEGKTAYIDMLNALAEEHDVAFPRRDSPASTDGAGDEEDDISTESPPEIAREPLQFQLVDPEIGYIEAVLGEFSEFLDRLFARYDVDYPEPSMFRFYGAGQDGHGYALDVRYETLDEEEEGGELSITLFEIVSMIVSDAPESGGMRLTREEMISYLYENFAE